MNCRGLIGETPTRRELEALRLISEGLNGVEVAKSMGIAYQTLKNHLAHVYAKFNVHREVHAVMVALKRGLI